MDIQKLTVILTRGNVELVDLMNVMIISSFHSVSRSVMDAFEILFLLDQYSCICIVRIVTITVKGFGVSSVRVVSMETPPMELRQTVSHALVR